MQKNKQPLREDKMRLGFITHEYHKPPVEKQWRTKSKYQRLEPGQVYILERYFEEHPNPDPHRRQIYADVVGTTFERVTNWFQNERRRQKKRMDKSPDPLPLNAPRPSVSHDWTWLKDGFNE